MKVDFRQLLQKSRGRREFHNNEHVSVPFVKRLMRPKQTANNVTVTSKDLVKILQSETNSGIFLIFWHLLFKHLRLNSMRRSLIYIFHWLKYISNFPDIKDSFKQSP